MRTYLRVGKGQARLDRIATQDRILVSSGRISSEMLLRAARMGTPVVASRTPPTDMAIGLAHELNITVCGYMRPDGLNLYAGTGARLDAPAMRAGGVVAAEVTLVRSRLSR